MISKLRISFLLFESRPNLRGQVPIFYRLILDKKLKTHATGIYINAREWCKISQRVIGSTDRERLLNSKLSELESTYVKIERQLYDEGKEVTLEAIYARFSGKVENTVKLTI